MSRLALSTFILLSTLCRAQELAVELSYDLTRTTFYLNPPDSSMYLSTQYQPVESTYHVEEFNYTNGDFFRQYTLIPDSFTQRNWTQNPSQIQITSWGIRYCSQDDCSEIIRDSLKRLNDDAIWSRLIREPFDLPLQPVQLGYLVSLGFDIEENSVHRLTLKGDHGVIQMDQSSLTESEFQFDHGDTSYSVTSYQILSDGSWFAEQVLTGEKHAHHPEKMEMRQYRNVNRSVHTKFPNRLSNSTSQLLAIQISQNQFEFRLSKQLSEEESISIIDQSGRIVQVIRLQSDSVITQLNLPVGIYHARLNRSNHTTTFTINP